MGLVILPLAATFDLYTDHGLRVIGDEDQVERWGLRSEKREQNKMDEVFLEIRLFE